MKAFYTSVTGQLSLGLVLVAAVFVAFAVGGAANEVLSIRCAIFGASVIGAVVVLARRS